LNYYDAKSDNGYEKFLMIYKNIKIIEKETEEQEKIRKE